MTIARVRRLILVAMAAVAALCVTAGVLAQERRSTWPEVDAIFADFTKPGSPGCAVGVFKDGVSLYQQGYGLASVEHGVRITPETAFYAGSVSKQFTAFAAALAIQQGSLGADDSIRKWLPELPSYTDGITVRHLVHHTSGLRDYNTLLSIAGRRGDEAFDNAIVLRMTARQRALNFEPGSEYLYSNTGYTLLATIVERATKTPFVDYAAKMIFQPLGMTVTHFHTDTGRLVPARALAYVGSADSLRLDSPINERAGAGGLYTNVPDLLKWDENFYTAKVGGAALIQQIQTSRPLNDGTAQSYAWGLMIGSYRGQPIVEHSGSLGGYRAHTLRFPAQHASFVALCNLASADPGARVRRVADVVLKDRLTTTAPAPRPQPAAVGDGQPSRASSTPAGAPARLEMLTGAYISDEIDATFTVTLNGDTLMLQRDTDATAVAMQPAGEGFRARGLTIRFERADGPAPALVVDAGRVRNIRFGRIATASGRK